MQKEEARPLFAEERRESILRMLDEQSKLLVTDLCDAFGVSPATIRTDLRDLERTGRLKRTHGGAIPVGRTRFEATTLSKENRFTEEKKRIGITAAALVQDGDTIALDTGTTTLELARCLSDKKDLTIVTNDIKIAALLESSSNASIIVAGGMLRRGFHCTYGTDVMRSLEGLNVDKAFMAANALDLEKGFTTPSIGQAEVKRAMISIAVQTYFLLDSSKLGKVAFTQFADLSQVDYIITDTGATGTMRAGLEALEDTEVLFV